MGSFDKNAAFLWAIILLGLAMPAVLALFASFREQAALKRLARLNDASQSIERDLRRARRIRTVQIGFFAAFVILGVVVRLARV